MNLTLDLNTIAQAVMVVVLTGVGGAVWRASIAIAAVVADLNAHKSHDETVHAEVRQDIRDLRDAVARRSTAPNGGWPS